MRKFLPNKFNKEFKHTYDINELIHLSFCFKRITQTKIFYLLNVIIIINNKIKQI